MQTKDGSFETMFVELAAVGLLLAVIAYLMLPKCEQMFLSFCFFSSFSTLLQNGRARHPRPSAASATANGAHSQVASFCGVFLFFSFPLLVSS